jgi:hypothetical protein
MPITISEEDRLRAGYLATALVKEFESQGGDPGIFRVCVIGALASLDAYSRHVPLAKVFADASAVAKLYHAQHLATTKPSHDPPAAHWMAKLEKSAMAMKDWRTDETSICAKHVDWALSRRKDKIADLLVHALRRWTDKASDDLALTVLAHAVRELREDVERLSLKEGRVHELHSSECNDPVCDLCNALDCPWGDKWHHGSGHNECPKCGGEHEHDLPDHCTLCDLLACPYDDPLHHRHDGCPSCDAKGCAP